MRLIVIILFMLSSVFCFAQKAVAGGSGKYIKPGVDLNIIPSIQAFAIDSDTIELWWTTEKVNSYIVERATDQVFTTPVQIYSGTDSIFTDQGLNANTDYYYRVRGISSGGRVYNNSPVASSKTLDSYVFWGEFTQGIQTSGQNKFGFHSSPGLYDTVYSVTSENYLLGNTTVSNIIGGNNSAATTLSGSNMVYGLDSIPFNQTSFYIQHYTGFAGTNNIVTDGTTTLRFTVGGVQIVGSAWNASSSPSLPSIDSISTIVIQISNDTIRSSTDLGQTWSIGTNANLDNTFYWTDWVGGHTMERLVIDSVIWDQAQIQEINNYYDNSSTVYETAIGTDFASVSYNTMDSVYYVDPDYNLATTAPSYDQVLSIGNQNLINIVSEFSAPLYGVDALLSYKTGGLLSPKIHEFPQPIDNVDSHNTGTIFKYGDRVGHLETDIHYDTGQRNKPVLHLSGSNYDLSTWTEVPLFHGASDLFDYTQYYKIKVVDSLVYMFHQSFNPAGYTDRINLAKTTDFQNFDILNVCDTETTQRWLYCSVAYTENDTIALFLRETATTPPLENNNYFLWSADGGRTWGNIDNTYSKDVKANGGITLDELQDSTYRIITATTGQTDNDFMFYDPSDGTFYTAVPDGADSLALVYGRIGEGFTVKKVDPLGKTLIVTGGGGNNPFANRISANTYDVYCHEEKAGNWTIVRYRTVDSGDNWTFEETVQSSTGNKLQRMYPTLNWHYSTQKILTAWKTVGSNNHLFIKEL